MEPTLVDNLAALKLDPFQTFICSWKAELGKAYWNELIMEPENLLLFSHFPLFSN